MLNTLLSQRTSPVMPRDLGRVLVDEFKQIPPVFYRPAGPIRFAITDASARLGLGGTLRAFPRVGIEQALPEPHRFRRHLHELVVGDVGNRLLEGHLDGRRQAHGLVLGGGANIGELLPLDRVHLEVVVAGVLADDHALVHLRAGRHEHRTAVLEVPQRIGNRRAVGGRDQHARSPALDRALIGRVAVEEPAHDAGAARVRQEFALVADEAAGRRLEDQPLLAAARGPHLLELALPARDLVDDDPRELLVDVDHDLLDGLEALAGLGIALEEDARARDRELVAFAPHGLDEDTELQLAAARDLDRVLLLALRDAYRDVALGLAPQALDDEA